MEFLGLITFKTLGIISNKNDIDRNTEPYEKNFEINVSDDMISGSYTHDLNILELNECVIKIMDSYKMKRLIELEKIITIESYKVQSPQYIVDRNSSLNKLKDAEIEIDDFKNDIKKNEYINRVIPILNEYKIIKPLNIYVTFGKGVRMNHSEDIIKKLQRFSLIERYLNVATKYVSINIYKKSTSKGCTLCGYDISNIESIENENIICPNCDMEITDISKSKGDNLTVIKKSSSNYEGRVNFVNELYRFQGKPTKSKIPPDLHEILDKHFIKRRFPTGNDIRSKPELLKKTSKELMYMALKEIKMPALYKDINSICNSYWGYELLNLERLEPDIMNKYDKINEVYEILKDDRSSSLNTQYELWWILDLLDYPCSPSDFKIPKTPDIFNYHETMRKKICDNLGWPYKSLDYISL